MQLFEALQEVDESEMFPLIQSVKRLTAFAETHSIVQYNTLLANNTFTILKWAVYNEGFSSEFVSRALCLARAIITWNLHNLFEMLKSSSTTNNSSDDKEQDDTTTTTSDEQRRVRHFFITQTKINFTSLH